MKLENFYEKLTCKQKEKFKDKKALALFYDWEEQMNTAKLTYEEKGMIITGLLYYAKNEPLPIELEKQIEENVILNLLFLNFAKTTAEASRKWVNLRGGKKDTESTTANEETNTDTLPNETTKTAREGNRDNENDITKMSEQEKRGYIYCNWPELELSTEEDMEKTKKQIDNIINEFGISQTADLVYFYDYNKTHFNQSLSEQIEEMRKDKLPKFD